MRQAVLRLTARSAGYRAGARGRRAGVGAAEARRRRSVVAPERLRELGRLPVADAVCDVPDGQLAFAQQLERAPHPHLRDVRAEASPRDLGEGALELAARGRGAPRDVVELDRVRVFALDDLRGLLDTSTPACLRSRSDRHGPDTRKCGVQMS